MNDMAMAAGAPSQTRQKSKRGKTRTLTPGYRLEVASRSLAAIVGGFVLASGVAMIVSALLAQGVQARGPAISSGTLISWLFWTGGAMWAFYARSQLAAWAWLVIPGAALWAAGVFLGFGG
jgi:hypothetical protein